MRMPEFSGMTEKEIFPPGIGTASHAFFRRFRSICRTRIRSRIPVATTAIGKAGAKNAAILAAQMIGLADPAVMQKVIDFKKAQAEKVLANSYLDK